MGRRRYKTSRRRMRRRSMRMSANLMVYKNPFSLATTNPKIPDGKCMLSAGQRLQVTRELVNDSVAPMEILLYPGLQNGLTAVGVDATGNGELALTGQLNSQTLRYSNHVRYDPTAGDTAIEQIGARVAAWRIVSQGVKLSLVNNFDENDGWWEAVRIQANNDSDHWTVASGIDGAGVTTYNRFTSIPDWTTLGIATRNLIEHPSYKSGKLRDIGKQRFQLKPHMLDHDFVRIGESVATGGYVGTTAAVYDKTDASGVELDRFIDENQDNSYDMLLIRIHGRPGAVSPTRILSHLVCNQEIMYSEDSPLARFHNVGKKEASFDSVKASHQRSVAAATPTSMQM